MKDIRKDFWNIVRNDYPNGGTDRDLLQFFLQFATLAPSRFNSQPWLYTIDKDTIKLYADRRRALYAVDPFDRELILACGASLFHLQLAMHYFGYGEETSLLPEGTENDLLATIRLGGQHSVSEEESVLFHAMPQRRTNRFAFEDRSLNDKLIKDLELCARAEGAWMHCVHDYDKKLEIAQLIIEAQQLQSADDHTRREFAKWLHAEHSNRQDGMPGSVFGVQDHSFVYRSIYSKILRSGTGVAGSGLYNHRLGRR